MASILWIFFNRWFGKFTFIDKQDTYYNMSFEDLIPLHLISPALSKSFWKGNKTLQWLNAKMAFLGNG